VKPYVCSECAEGFRTAAAFMSHKLVHLDFKEFCCNNTYDPVRFRLVNQSGFTGTREWVAVEPAGPYASLHLDPDITTPASHHSVFYRPKYWRQIF